MSRKMLINASHPEENRVAIVVDGILSELDIEIAGQEQTKGNIYKAVVVRVETGLQAAFVDYGAEKLGFLQIGEIHPNIYPPKNESKSRPRIAEILQRGQEILVQIVKEERGNKGAALTTYLSIPGRYMVLMPDSSTKGVSRKIIEDSERKKLKRTMAELDLPEKMGYIVRTAGIGKDKEELKRDFDYLVRLYEGIVSRQDQIKAPAQLYQESNLVIRSIRDYFATDMDEVLIDTHQVYQDTRDFFALVMPELKHMVKRHRERRPIFSRYQIEEQIDGLAKNQTALSSGGSIVIDQTEALVAIDVNSGKMASESGIEATALKTNLEAASEVGRQLRLRDLGGLVVIDFIDMRDRKNVREVEQQLRNALKDDKAKVSVGRISQFGLMEMSRQRLKPALSVGSYEDCPHCKGAGRVRSAEAQAVTILRQAHTSASKGQIGQIDATVPVDVANYLLNQKRSTVVDLERQLNLRLNIQGSVDMLPGESDLQLHRKEKEQNEPRQILPVSHANQIDVALAAQQEEQNVPVPDQEETNTEAGQAQPEQAEATEAPKKRRRRRRKKPASSEQQSGQATPQSNAPESEERNNVAQEASTQITDEKIAAVEPETPTEGEKTEEKPKRRSRRPARRRTQAEEEKPSAETVQASATEAVKTAVPAEEVASVTQETENAPEETPKPTRARRPRRATRKKPTETQSSETTAQSENAPIQTQTPEQVEADKPAESSEEKPQRKPRRAPRKKVETPEVGTTTVKTEEKPKRRPRKTVPKVEDEKPAEQKPAQDEEISQKPQRRTRRTTKKTETVEKQPESEGLDTSVDKTPPKARPTRTRRTKSAETTATTNITESAEKTAPAAEKSEEKPKRRTRKTVKKVTESAVTPEPTTETEKSEQEKPKRRPRRTTKKETASKVSPSDQANKDKEEPAPKPPRKRTPRKKVEESTD